MRLNPGNGLFDIARVTDAVSQGKEPQAIAAAAFAPVSQHADSLLAELRRATANARAIIQGPGSANFARQGKDAYMLVHDSLQAQTQATLAAVDAAIGHLEAMDPASHVQAAGRTMAVLRFAACEIEVRHAGREMELAMGKLARAAED